MYLHLPMYDWMNALGTITSSCFLNLLNFRLEFFSSSFHTLPVYWNHEQVLLTLPCLMGFSLHQCIIHGSLVRHPWEPRINPACTSMGTPHVYVHGNLAPHHYLAPLAIFLCWAFLSKIFVCGPFRLSLSLLGNLVSPHK